jgi:hypothetical protein
MAVAEAPLDLGADEQQSVVPLRIPLVETRCRTIGSDGVPIGPNQATPKSRFKQCKGKCRSVQH